MRSRIMAQIMMRYAVKVGILAWMLGCSFFILPAPFKVVVGMIPALLAIMLWMNFEEDRDLDEDFGDFSYDAFFSLRTEKGKFKILNRQLRSYDEMLRRIARSSDLSFETKAIRINDGEMMIARAEFETPCEMMRFLYNYQRHFLYPYMARWDLGWIE